MNHIDAGSAPAYNVPMDMSRIFTVENAATLLSIGGAIVNIRKSRWGFAIWIVASIIWILWGLSAKPEIHWGFCLTQTVFLGINIWGFISWSKGEKKDGTRSGSDAGVGCDTDDGGFLVWRGLKRPKATNNDLDLAVEAHNRAAAELMTAANELKCERAMLCQIAREMQSNLMLASGQTSCLTPKEEHDLHVEAEVARRRDDMRAQMPPLPQRQTVQH